jgi:hypothetical protein
VKLRILPEDFKLFSVASTQIQTEVIVQAKKITINSNDYKTADTFNMTIDYKNFPFDPRTIRACGVVIYLQDMQSLTKLVPSDANAIFSGFVDTETINLDENAQAVHFEGRDFTSLLIDQKYTTNKPISEQLPLDQALAAFMAQIPALAQFSVLNQTGDVLPSLSSFYPDHASLLNGQKNPGTRDTYWDLIQDAARRAGLICFIHLNSLVLTTPKNQSATIGSDIKFIYGRNVKKLELKRKLGRQKGINILVRSRTGKNVITARIPLESDPAWAAAFGLENKEVVIPVLLPTGALNTTPITAIPKGSTPQTATKKTPAVIKEISGQTAPYISFSIPNVNQHSQLVKIGQTLYEQYSLQQLEGTLTTREMTGWGPPLNVSGTFQQKSSIGTQLANTKQYDLTQISKGQSIFIEIDTDDLAAIARFQDATTREQYLVKHGYDKSVAAIFAKAMGKFSPRFFIKSYVIELDADSGFSLDINFYNIIDLNQAGL